MWPEKLLWNTSRATTLGERRASNASARTTSGCDVIALAAKLPDAGGMLHTAHLTASSRASRMYVAESKRLTYQGAKKMMAAAIEMADRAGIAISCAIVDAGGHVILLERMDGGRFHTVHSCTTKAVCAASNRRATTAKERPVRTSTSATRSVLRSPPGRSDGQPWRAVCRC